MDALLNPDWLSHLCRLIAECVETDVVSHRYWHENDLWRIEMFPAVVEKEGAEVYDTTAPIDLLAIQNLVTHIAFFQCDSSGVVLEAMFMDNRFQLELTYQPPEDAAAIGRLRPEGGIEVFESDGTTGRPD